MGFLDFNDDDQEKVVEDGKMVLHEEELDIAKDKVHTGEVILGKEIVEEHKSVNVPVTHEEVVIERRAVNREPSDAPIQAEEAIHIPVTEEKVEVGKHTVVTGEVKAYKREVEENEEVDAVLKREEARIDSEGDPEIIADENQLE